MQVSDQETTFPVELTLECAMKVSQRIRTMEKDALRHQTAIDEDNLLIAKTEAHISLAVANEAEDAPKEDKSLSNAEKRKTEINRRLDGIPAVRDARQRLSDTSGIVAIIKLDIDHAKRTHRAILSFTGGDQS